MPEREVVKLVNSAPALWIERAVIYEDVSEKSIVREIEFRRGLNIIYGVSELSDLQNPPSDSFLMGHSVGKTSLSRLIRFALGEDTMGQEEYAKELQRHFPRGAIALKLHMKETQWSVLRWFQGGNARSYASTTQSIDELAGQKKLSQTDYALFREALQTNIVQDIPGFGQNSDFKWRDLLAWLSRDQEARFESLWKWRDSRSNSPFGLNKASALRLIGNVLGVFSEETNRLVRRREALEVERSKLNDAVAAHERRRNSDAASYDSDITRILAKYGYSEAASSDLFSIESSIPDCQDAIRQILDVLAPQRSDLAWQLYGHQNEIRQTEELIATIRTSLRIEKDGVETTRRIDELEEAVGRNCKYGDILVGKCNYFIDNINRRRADIIARLQADTALDDSDVYQQKVDQLILEEFNLSGTLERERENVRRILANLDDLDAQIGELRFESDQVTRLAAAKSRSVSKSPYVKSVEEVDRQMKTLSAELTLALSQQIDAEAELRALFDRLVKFIFSGAFRGVVKPPSPELLQFSIVGKGGEAVGTLTSVLADVCAMFLSVEGYGFHPRFLIHDSPREADLSGAAYGNYLAKVHALAVELGGEEAPFQYIVTTTTKPPAHLDDCIRLRLCGYPEEQMLFKKNIDADLNTALNLEAAAE